MNARAAAVVVLLAAATPALAAELRVEPNKENVVASRPEGTWRPHAALTQRLTGQAPRRGGESPTGILRFQADPSIVPKIPEKYHRHLAERTLFLAGHMTSRGTKHPFLLIALNGNPHVLYFRERDGDPMGDGESFNLMLAPAKDRARDLLFIGGDFNNQPFSAYERQPAEPAARVPQAQPALALLKAAKANDLPAFKAVWCHRATAKHDREGWETVLARARESLADRFGDYDPAAFRFHYGGDDRAGTLTIIYGAQRLPGNPVLREGDAWKLDVHVR